MELQKKLHDRISAFFNKQGFLGLIGAELEHVEKGKAIVSCKRKGTLTQQHGLLHAGVTAALADVACGAAALTAMQDDAEVMSVEFKINMLRPADVEKIVATGLVIKAGRTLVITEATVTDESGEKLIAKMQATMIVSHIK